MRTGLVVGGLAVAALLAAGCSSGSAPGASYPAGTINGGAGANDGPNAKSLYISCLDSHGAHLPPPGSEHSDSAAIRNSPQLHRAAQACRSLRPVGAQPLTVQDQIYYLRAARCMRAHGVAGFPDPVFADGGVNFPIPAGLDIHTPQVQRAVATCRRLIPQGLPYSG